MWRVDQREGKGGNGRVEGGEERVLFGDAMVLWREGRVEGGEERVLWREGVLTSADARVLLGDGRVLSGEEVVKGGDVRVLLGDGRVLFGNGALMGGDGALLAGTVALGAHGGGVVPTLGIKVLSCPSCLNNRSGVEIDRWPAERVAWDYGERRL